MLPLPQLYICSPSFQVLAVSDIVVYRTRAERLHNDMFVFLSSASGAYLKHFTPELRALSSRCGLDVPLSSLGPAVIIFQETTHTQLLGHGKRKTSWAEAHISLEVIFMHWLFFVNRFEGGRPCWHFAPEAFPWPGLGHRGVQLSSVCGHTDHHTSH